MAVPEWSDGEAASATAGTTHVRVVEFETAPLKVFVEIDHGAVQVEVMVLLDSDFHAVLVGNEVLVQIDFVIKAEAVLESAASAAGDANADTGFFWEILLGQDTLDFSSCPFGKGDHLLSPSS